MADEHLMIVEQKIDSLTDIVEKSERKIDALTSIVEKGFAAVANDIGDIREDIDGIHQGMTGLATKDQMFTFQTQINSIETQIRSMNRSKLESRVGDLEEEVFGESRA